MPNINEDELVELLTFLPVLRNARSLGQLTDKVHIREKDIINFVSLLELDFSLKSSQGAIEDIPQEKEKFSVCCGSVEDIPQIEEKFSVCCGSVEDIPQDEGFEFKMWSLV